MFVFNVLYFFKLIFHPSLLYFGLSFFIFVFNYKIDVFITYQIALLKIFLICACASGIPNYVFICTWGDYWQASGCKL